MIRKFGGSSGVDFQPVGIDLGIGKKLDDFSPSDNAIIFQAIPYQLIYSTTYVKRAEIKITRSGVVRVKFTAIGSGIAVNYGKICVNDVDVGTERSWSHPSVATFVEDIAVKSGDNIQLLFRISNSSYYISPTNITICAVPPSDIGTIITV